VKLLYSQILSTTAGEKQNREPNKQGFSLHRISDFNVNFGCE